MNDASSPPASIACQVYRASKRADTYVYVRECDGITQLPEGLLAITGRLELAMELCLTPTHRLARADVAEVMRALQERGYYLQLPPPEAGR